MYKYNDQMCRIAYKISTGGKWNQINKVTSDKAEACRWTTKCLYIIVSNYTVVTFINIYFNLIYVNLVACNKIGRDRQKGKAFFEIFVPIYVIFKTLFLAYHCHNINNVRVPLTYLFTYLLNYLRSYLLSYSTEQSPS